MAGTFLAEGTRALQCAHGGGCCKDALLGCLCWSGRVLGVTSLLTCAQVAGEDMGLLWVASAVSSAGQCLWVGRGKDRLGDGHCKEQDCWGTPERV